MVFRFREDNPSSSPEESQLGENALAFESQRQPGLPQQNGTPEQARYQFREDEDKINVPELFKETGKGLLRLGGRGATSLLAAPSKGIGSLLGLLSKIYPEDTGLRGAPRKGLSAASRFFQETGEAGQEHLKSLIEEALGTSYSSGEEALTQFTERVGDIYGRGPFRGMGTSALLGGGAGQLAQELGAPEEIQAGAELFGIVSTDIFKSLSNLKNFEKIREKSGLVLPRVVDKTKEGYQLVKGKVFPKAKQKAYDRVSKDATRLIDKIKSNEFPLSVEIEKGIDVESRLNKELGDVDRLASKMDHKIESTYVSDFLNDVEKNLEKVPVPSKEDEEILGLINKYRKRYGEFNGKRFYSPKEYVKQYRKINEDATSLYERAYLEGKKRKVRDFYRGLNKEIENTLEAGTPKDFSNLFKETNAQYHELKNLTSFENLLENVTKDGILDSNKLKNIFKSPAKSKRLRKMLGKDSYDQLRLISDDLGRVKDKVDLLNELNLKEVVKSSTLTALLAKLGVAKAALPLLGAKKGGELMYGYFLLNPKGQRDFKNFLRALESGNRKAVQRYLVTMDKQALQLERENQ